MDTDLVDRLLPVATLVLGAVLTRWGARGEAKRSARKAAAEHLAELTRVLWSKGQESTWLDMQVFLGRLSVALRMAGVPQRVVGSLRDTAEAAWSGLEVSSEPGIAARVRGDRDVLLELKHAEGRVADWLESPWRLWRRWSAWKEAGKA